MSSYNYPERHTLTRYVMSHLIVRQLQSILKSEGLPTSGLKAPLQKRLTGRMEFPRAAAQPSGLLTMLLDIDDLITNGDTSGLERVRNLIYRPESPAPSRNSTVNYNQTGGYVSPAPPMPQTPPYSAPAYASPSTGCAPYPELLIGNPC